MRARLSLSVLLLVAACGGPSVTPYAVGFVTPSGASPLAIDGGVTHVSIVVKQGTAAAQTIDEDVTGGSYVHDLAITDFSSLVQVRATLTTPAGPLVGAPPDFLAGETPVRVPVGAPSTCAVVAGATFATARAHPAAEMIGSFVVVTDADGAVEYFDGLTLSVDPMHVDMPAGFAGGVRLVQLAPRTASLSGALLACATTSDTLVRYTLSSDATMRARPLVAPHPGAHGGTPLALGTNGAVVVGGVDASGASGVTGVTFVGTDGFVDPSTALLAPRIAPAVVQLHGAGALLVAGGSATAPPGELVLRDMPSTMVAGPADARRGGALFVDASGAHAVLVGGVDAAGAPVASTLLFDCSSATCVVTSGPMLADARAGATAVALPGGGGLLIGGRAPGPSNHVTRVRVDASGTPSFEALHLAVPRASPAAYVLPSGVVYVVAGTAPDGARSDVEVCFPDVLASPT